MLFSSLLEVLTMGGLYRVQMKRVSTQLFLTVTILTWLSGCDLESTEIESDSSLDGAEHDSQDGGTDGVEDMGISSAKTNGFVQIVSGGIDDRRNGYPWAMEQFDGDRDGTPEIYIGTVHNPLCLQVVLSQLLGEAAGLLAELDPPPERWQCRNDLWDNPLEYVEQSISPGSVYRGEYQPDEKTWLWTRVFAPRAEENLGFRGARVYNNALYLLGMSETEGIVWKTTDGRNFEIVSPSGMALSGLGVAGGLRGTQVYKGKLYVASNGACEIFASEDPSSDPDSWKQVNSTGFVESGGETDETGNPTNRGFWQIGVFNGYLYAGTTNLNGPELWKSDNPRPGNWTRVIDRGWGNPTIQGFMSIRPFGDYLYLGSVLYPVGATAMEGCDILRLDKNDNVQLLVGKTRNDPTTGQVVEPLSGMSGGFNWLANVYSWYMVEYQDEFYVGTFDMSGQAVDYAVETIGVPYEEWDEDIIAQVEESLGLSDIDWSRVGGADLYKTRNGVDWIPVNLDGFGDRDNYGIRNLLATQWGLMVGMANPIDGFELWLLPK